MEQIRKPCPFNGIAYSAVPGYRPGYGCPVCKGIGHSHLTVPDFSSFKPSPRLGAMKPGGVREVTVKQTNNKPVTVKLKTYSVFHGQKQIGQVQAVDSHDAYAQAREHHKIPLAVIGRKEGV